MATRCFCPPESCFGFGLPNTVQSHTNFFKVFFGNFFCFCTIALEDGCLGNDGIFQDIEIFKEIERLENHP